MENELAKLFLVVVQKMYGITNLLFLFCCLNFIFTFYVFAKSKEKK